MDIKLAYGIKNGHIVHISEIAPAENGEKCNCTCPICGDILIAKLGDKRQHHFSHKAVSDCDIKKAQETGLHKLAKEILQENQSILVPGFEIYRKDVEPFITDTLAASDSIDKMDSCKVEYDSVEIEKPIDDHSIIADAVIKVKDKSCIIEVAVSHFVDDDKKDKLKKIGISAFEIDLHNLLKTSPSRDEIKNAVLFDEKNRYWVWNTLREERLKKAQKAYQEKHKDITQETKQNKVQKQETITNSDNYVKKPIRAKSEATASRGLKMFSFAKELSEYPFFMNIPITGECVFLGDRPFWQGKLFEDYIYSDNESFTISEIKTRITTEKTPFEYDRQNDNQEIIIFNNKVQNNTFLYNVIWRYFDYMELLGFVEHKGSKWYPKTQESLDPPNTHAANILNDVLKSINRSSSNIDQTIKNELLSRLSEEACIVHMWFERKIAF